MGSQLHPRIQGITMKFFVLASLLALAAAESDPYVYYQTHGHFPSWYNGQVYNGMRYFTPASTQLLTYNNHHQFPSMTYQNTFDMFNQRHFGTQGYRHFIKRDAEAEAEADPYVFYSTHGYYPSWYTGYSRRVYNNDMMYNFPQQYQYGQQYQQVAPVAYNQPMMQTPFVYNQPQMAYAQHPQAFVYHQEHMYNRY